MRILNQEEEKAPLSEIKEDVNAAPYQVVEKITETKLGAIYVVQDKAAKRYLMHVSFKEGMYYLEVPYLCQVSLLVVE